MVGLVEVCPVLVADCFESLDLVHETTIYTTIRQGKQDEQSQREKIQSAGSTALAIMWAII